MYPSPLTQTIQKIISEKFMVQFCHWYLISDDSLLPAVQQFSIV